MLGLELLDHAAHAVDVDESGQVRARARVDASRETLRAAVDTVLAEVAPASGLTSLGVAANVDSAGVADLLTTVAIRYPGPVIPSGAASAVAEAWVGAARGAQNVVWFGAGDRTAGGIIRDGAPVVGARGRAASVAWMSLNPVEREDYRKIGCLEAEVAAAGIVRRLIWRVKAGDDSQVMEAVDNEFSRVTLDHVLAAARSGDGVSISVIRDTAKYLGMAAANLVLMMDPEVLVLGGIMADAADLVLDTVRAEINRRVPRSMMEALTIAPALLGDDAAAVGAARHAAAALR